MLTLVLRDFLVSHSRQVSFIEATLAKTVTGTGGRIRWELAYNLRKNYA